MLKKITKNFEINVYVYNKIETGELLHSLRNFTYQEMMALDLEGGIITDAQEAIVWAENMNAHINGWLEKVCSNKIKAYLTIGTGLGKWNKNKSLESILVPCEDGTCIDVIDLLDSLSEDREEAFWLIYKMASNWVSIYSVNSFPEIWKLYSSMLKRDPDNVELKRMVEDCWADIKKDFIDIYVTHSTFMSYDIFY